MHGGDEGAPECRRGSATRELEQPWLRRERFAGPAVADSAADLRRLSGRWTVVLLNAMPCVSLVNVDDDANVGSSGYGSHLGQQRSRQGPDFAVRLGRSV